MLIVIKIFRKENTAEALPEGFFDDPEVDAKVSDLLLCARFISANCNNFLSSKDIC